MSNGAPKRIKASDESDLPLDADFLAAALAGYEQKRQEIDLRIAELRRRLGESSAPAPSESPAPAPAPPAPVRTKPVLTPEARERIAAAQRKRWAAAAGTPVSRTATQGETPT
jgi:hypothetical protein